MMSGTKKVSIIGSGMAGHGAACRLRQEGISPVVYEKNPYIGGHTASWTDRHGFTFDEGPHISFTKDNRIRELFAESVNHEYISARAVMNNYWRGYWIKHPVQCNLYGLPYEIVTNVIHDFVEEMNVNHRKISNYSDWLSAAYGKTFAEIFPMEYGARYHTTTADNMSTDWLGPRLYRPSLKEVLHGALSPETDDVHYITDFRYPLSGGFASYLALFGEGIDFQLNCELIRVDVKEKTLEFKNGEVKPYDYLISSMPLPRLVNLLDGVPGDIVEAVRRLACSQCVLVNIGINRADISDAHVSYFYDRDFIFTRLSFPHMQSPNNVPPGCGSIQAELYYSEKYRPLDMQPEECVQPVIRDLIRCGLLKETDEIITSHARLIPHANVIYDLERAESLAAVQGYLEDINVQSCGRYGEWCYYWTDESFKSGEQAAQMVLDRM